MASDQAVDIGSRRELMVDDFLIDRMTGAAALRLHHPMPREVSLVTDRPWEGNMCAGFKTVFRDGDVIRLYYQSWHSDLSGGTFIQPHALANAYAESADGIHWTRPDLGIIEFDGSCKNNLVWMGEGEGVKGVHGFAPFKDASPGCTPDARYKGVGAMCRALEGGLFPLASPDGLHWSLMQDEPIITEGKFDSQNLAFWDPVRQEYRAYVRDFRDRIRGIRTATSEDFIHWTHPEWLEYPGAPEEQLYTNQVMPYYRAPHILVGFPTRYVEREWTPSIEALPELEHRRLRSAAQKRYGTALTDGLFMSSRDGRTFKRWGEAFLRPGPQLVGNWAYGDNYQCWGMVETEADLCGAPPEISVYANEGYWRGEANCIRRYSIRVDGFVSATASLSGGEVVTKPLTFDGHALELNVATSAAGTVRVEVQDDAGEAIPGLSLADGYEVIGDRLDYRVRWSAGCDVGRLARKPIRLRFVLSDADLYSFRFVT